MFEPVVAIWILHVPTLIYSLILSQKKWDLKFAFCLSIYNLISIYFAFMVVSGSKSSNSIDCALMITPLLLLPSLVFFIGVIMKNGRLVTMALIWLVCIWFLIYGRFYLEVGKHFLDMMDKIHYRKVVLFELALRYVNWAFYLSLIPATNLISLHAHLKRKSGIIDSKSVRAWENIFVGFALLFMILYYLIKANYVEWIFLNSLITWIHLLIEKVIHQLK